MLCIFTLALTRVCCGCQLEQAVEKEMAWFRDTALALEDLKAITLDSDQISSQLYEQKVTS